MHILRCYLEVQYLTPFLFHFQYEQELNDLRQKLGETQRILSETQNRLQIGAGSDETTQAWEQPARNQGETSETPKGEAEADVTLLEKDAQIQEILSRSLSK